MVGGVGGRGRGVIHTWGRGEEGLGGGAGGEALGAGPSFMTTRWAVYIGPQRCLLD